MPSIKLIQVYAGTPMMQASKDLFTTTESSDSRKFAFDGYSWDDDEEEDTGGWFK